MNTVLEENIQENDDKNDDKKRQIRKPRKTKQIELRRYC